MTAKTKKEKPNCYDCKHRRDIPYDCHSYCAHPKLENSLWCLFFRKNNIGVTGNSHGISHGWFNFPVNFDPVWLETCEGFEKKT